MSALFGSESAADDVPADSTIPSAAGVSGSPALSPDVGRSARKPLTDAELERHIRSCGWLMDQAMRRYEKTSDVQDIGEAHRWRVLMEEAIKARRPCFVSKLERARGLA